MGKNYELLRNGDQKRDRLSYKRIRPAPQFELVPESAPVPDEVPISAYFRVVWTRRWTVVGFALLVTSLVGLVSFATPPKYEGIAQIAIYRENQGLLTVKQDAHDSSEDSDYTVTLDTQAKIIEGYELANQVIQKLGLDRNPDFVNGRADYKAAVERFHHNLSIVKVPHTRLLQIRFLSSKPELAADVANALANAYIDHAFKVRYDTTMQASKRLADELADLREATNRSEARLVAYQRSHGMVGAEQLIGTRLADLNKDLTAVEVEKAQKEAEYNLVRSNGPDQVGRIDASSLLERLRARESEVRTEYAKVTSVMGPANPQVIELKEQLDEIHRSIAAERDRMRRRIGNEYQAVIKRENWLRRALENAKQEATHQNQDAIEYNNLKREADTSQQLYVDLLQKLKEAELAAGLRADNVRIEGLATVPTKPSRPNIPSNLAVALFGGLVGGLVLALVRDHLDGRVRTAQQAEIISGAPALAIIPKVLELTGTVSKSTVSARLAPSSLDVAIVKADSPVIESYRALRSLLSLHFSDCSPRVLLVTSPLPGEGKTTTAINAAMTFAQNGRRVLLIDADLRNPSIHRAWGFDAPVEGFSTVAGGESSLAGLLLLAPGKDNLFILPAGTMPADPAAMLGGERMKQLLSNLKQEFAYIIIDSPPVLGPSDTLVLAANADAVLLVIRESSTPKQALAQSCALLDKAKAPALAIVVNAVDKSHLSDYHYYGQRANSWPLR